MGNSQPQNFDVIVCGAGTAGQTAAVFAARRGASVLAVDLADVIGGNTQRSTGQISAAGTRLQAERGIHDTPDLHYQDIMRISGNTADPALTRLAVDHAAETLQWLLDNGLRLLPDMPVIFKGHEPYEIARTYWGPDRGGRPLQAVLGEQFMHWVEQGAITLRLETEVLDLCKSDNGRVTGVLIRNAAENTQRIIGKNVLLTMGGYNSNAKIFPRYSNGYPLFKGGPDFGSHPNANGRGHELGEKIGGYIRNQDYFMPTFGRVKDPEDPSYVSNVTLIHAASLLGTRPLWEIFVDASGRRFVCEDSDSPDTKEAALLGIPDLTFWVIFDQRAREESECIYAKMTHAEADPLYNHHESFRRAETLEALAAATRIDADGLCETVSAYNQAVQRGEDPEYGRTHLPAPIARPPFYAIKHHGMSLTSFAGLAVNERLQLIGKNGAPIEGVYAAGESLGLGATSGKAFCGGMGLMSAMTFGRLLGDRILEW